MGSREYHPIHSVNGKGEGSLSDEELMANHIMFFMDLAKKEYYIAKTGTKKEMSCQCLHIFNNEDVAAAVAKYCVPTMVN